eukprot:g45101.t1
MELEERSRSGSIKGAGKSTFRIATLLFSKGQLSCSSDAAWPAELLQLHTVVISDSSIGSSHYLLQNSKSVNMRRSKGMLINVLTGSYARNPNQSINSGQNRNRKRWKYLARATPNTVLKKFPLTIAPMLEMFRSGSEREPGFWVTDWYSQDTQAVDSWQRLAVSDQVAPVLAVSAQQLLPELPHVLKLTREDAVLSLVLCSEIGLINDLGVKLPQSSPPKDYESGESIIENGAMTNELH